MGSACTRRKGLIQEVKLLVVASPKLVVLLVVSQDIHRSGEKNNELLRKLIDSVMCLEGILHVGARENFLHEFQEL